MTASTAAGSASVSDQGQCIAFVERNDHDHHHHDGHDSHHHHGDDSHHHHDWCEGSSHHHHSSWNSRLVSNVTPDTPGGFTVLGLVATAAVFVLFAFGLVIPRRRRAPSAERTRLPCVTVVSVPTVTHGNE